MSYSSALTICLSLQAADSEMSSRPRRAYCFLPLPVRTGLPVQINGHFALDHEARRALWIDEDTGPKTDWNYMLMREVTHFFNFKKAKVQ